MNTRKATRQTVEQFQEILNSSLLQSSIKKYIGDEAIDIVERPACYVIRAKHEDTKLVKRLILLHPHGYTADEPNLMNPHPEAFKARARILGKINPGKKGYKPCVREVQLTFSNDNKAPTQKSSAYSEYSEAYGGLQLKSWKNWFYVVKKNRWGDFHNLTNLSDEWIVLVIEKWLVDQKKINIEPYLRQLSSAKARALKQNLKKIQTAGDEIFSEKKVVSEVLDTPPAILIPILLQMLNVVETGRHESCTFFAILLKVAKQNKNIVQNEVAKASKEKLAPYYYLEDLQRKLQKSSLIIA